MAAGLKKNKRHSFEIYTSCEYEILTLWVYVAVTESRRDGWKLLGFASLCLSRCRLGCYVHFVFSSLAVHTDELPKWILSWGISLAPYLGKQKE